MKDRGLVVVPTYSEAENLPSIVSRVLALDRPLDVLVVDDSSPDGTGEIADRLAAESPGRVRVLHRPKKLGLGPAYRDGFRRALDLGYGAIAQMDADFSHDPAYLPVFLDLLADADLVVGSRYVAEGGTEHWGLGRRIVSRGGSAWARFFLGLPVRDATAGFKMWRRDTLAAIDLDAVRSNGYCFQVEMTYRALRRGARIVESPIVFPDRRVGRSKMSKAIFIEAVWRVPLLRFTVKS